MVSNEWVRKFIRDELSTIVLGLNRRNINEVTDMLVDAFEQQHLTVVPTYLSDEMYNTQKQLSTDLTYSDASLLYTSALFKYSTTKSLVVNEDNQMDDAY
jgi:hypothetical protein